MNEPLHPRQQAILGFIESYVAQKGYAPSVRDICQALEIPSTSTVTCHLDALQANGLILMDAGVSRSIRLVKPDNAETKAIGPRTERIMSRILQLGEQLEQPDKGQLVIDFAGDTIKIRLTVVIPGAP